MALESAVPRTLALGVGLRMEQRASQVTPPISFIASDGRPSAVEDQVVGRHDVRVIERAGDERLGRKRTRWSGRSLRIERAVLTATSRSKF